MFKGLGQMGDMAKMMKSAQELQQKMEQLQEDMHNMMVTGESGAGLVKATATAKGELKGLDIDPSIFNGDDKEVVEDLILAAIKDAQSRASDRAAEEMQKIQEELGLPAGMKLPSRPVHTATWPGGIKWKRPRLFGSVPRRRLS